MIELTKSNMVFLKAMAAYYTTECWIGMIEYGSPKKALLARAHAVIGTDRALALLDHDE